MGIEVLEENIFSSIRPHHDVAICGGEPTIHPKFEPVILGLLRKTDKVAVITNGACVSTAEKAKEFFRFLTDNPELAVIFSADTQHEEGVPGFKERLERLLEAHERFRIGFKVTERSAVECEGTTRRLGLPPNRTITSALWEEERLTAFGTERRVFIAETGDVHACMSNYLSGTPPIGSVIKTALSEVLRNID
jgi:hypothetical protein